MYRALKCRIYPSREQEQLLLSFIGAARFVYNLALEQREQHWRQFHANTGYHITLFSQSRELTECRAQNDWLNKVPRAILDYALQDADAAFRHFFAGRADRPRWRKRDTSESIRFKGVETKFARRDGRLSDIFLQRLGRIRIAITRPDFGRVIAITVKREAGRWFAILSCEVQGGSANPPGQEVGIDRGVASSVYLSNGESYSLPSAIALLEKRRRKAAKVLSRRKRGSNRRARQRLKVARLHARVADVRREWNHRITTDITRRFGLVAIEALKIGNMTRSAAGTVESPGKNVAQKRGLNRSILAQGWGQFERMLAYKLEASGGALVRVPAAYSSQTCQACGVIDAKSRKSQAVFECVACGHRDHADRNAALEILRRSTALLDVEGGHRSPCEASTLAA